MIPLNQIIIHNETKISDIILSNPYTILMLEHFNKNVHVKDYSISQYCQLNDINLEIFKAIIHLYNHSYKNDNDFIFQKSDLLTLVDFLKNSHFYYLNEKYPRIIYNTY